MNLLAKIGLWSVLVGGTAGVLYAEPAGGWLSPNGTSAGVAGSAQVGGTVTAGPGDASGSVNASVSLVDLQARVHLLHEQTRADSRHVQHLQQIARKEKDVIKLNCVNDKLVQLKPQLNLADLSEVELEAAGDGTRVGIFEGIIQSAENIRRLREEADQCIGEPIAQGGDSSNSFSGPHAPDDPTKGFNRPEIEPPAYASPYN
jgi:hypothetical protein